MKVQMVETLVGRGAPDAPKTTFYAGQSYEVDDRVAEGWIKSGTAKRAAQGRRGTSGGEAATHREE